MLYQITTILSQYCKELLIKPPGQLRLMLSVRLPIFSVEI